uniref:Zinc finger protein n=1 Tax=Rhizophora mucronata TaxID=61149 RepID=A0A2P2KUH5_RHIMU
MSSKNSFHIATIFLTMLHQFKHSNVNLSKMNGAYRQCLCISFTHSKCIVCPQGNAVMSFIVSNRNSKQTGQSWCIAPSTQWCASFIDFE